MSKVLQIAGLNKSYNGRKVVDNISLEVEKGDIVGLIGPNGAGKSTTMKMIMNLTGYDNLMLIAKLYDDVSAEKVKQIVEFVGLSEHIDKKVKTYSTGMRQRLGLGRALLNNPELLILDEPTNGLDPYGMKDIYEMLEKLAKEDDVAILISSHLLHDIEKICNKVVMINEGKILFSGDISELEEGLEDSYYSMYRRQA